MTLETLIAFRQLGAKRSRSLSIVSWLAISGLPLGLLPWSVAFQLRPGSRKNSRKRSSPSRHMSWVRQYGLGVRNHDEVAARIEQVDGVTATSPMTHDGALFSGPTGSVGAVVKG